MARKPAFTRTDRVVATMKKTLAAPLSEMVRAQSNALATITDVEVTTDMREGVVYLSLYGGDELDKVACLRAINLRAGDFQAVLGAVLRTKRTPVLQFRLDDTLERGDRIQRLLRTEDGAEDPR